MPTPAFRWYTGKILSLNVISVGEEALQIKYVGNVEQENDAVFVIQSYKLVFKSLSE